MRIREAGDSALVLEVGATQASPLHETQASPLRAVIDRDVNARAIGIAQALRHRAIAGVRDVVSTFRSVTVFFDPLLTDVTALAGAMHEETDAAAPAPVGGTVEVPVVYGGDAGPDLDEVAAFARCTAQAVVERHASQTYRVFMLGFLPGFPYMASVDETIAAPRRPTPRMRVPVGSVGIAGRQTGIYPRESPGGWQIIGRTALSLFDPARPSPALFAPGDHVRFVPTTDVGAGFLGAPKPLGGEGGSRPESEPPDRLKADPTATKRSVTVVRPGLLTTVQDSGRWGYQDRGVPVSGPMDHVAHRLANAIVGNPPDAATLEATLVGPELRMEQETRIALAGADLDATVGGVHIPIHAAVRCHAGSVLRFSERRSGARAYIAFDGGIAVTPVLGSRATHLLSGLGGIEGRAIRTGDRVPLGDPAADSNVRPYTRPEGTVAAADLRVRPAGGARLRVLPGPQADHFGPSVFDLLQGSRYTISPQSDRMGYRLAGGAPVPHTMSSEMISDAAFVGGLQLPPSGNPILLMADRQTSGGYPQLAVVITADLPLAAQLAPGDWVEFEVCTRADAIAALITQEGKLLAVR